MSAPIKLLGVIRVSTDGQAKDDRNGIPAQRTAILKIAKDLGAELLDVVILGSGKGVDGSESMKTAEWKSRVLPRLDGSVHIACFELDRLIRSSDFNFEILGVLRSKSAKIYEPGKVTDLDTDGMITIIRAQVAGEEREKIRKRTRTGKAEAHTEGRWAHPKRLLPTGLTYDFDTCQWGYEPTEAAKVKAVFEMWVSGKSLQVISRAMGMSYQSCRAWLVNPLFKGIKVDAWTTDERKGPSRRKRPDEQTEVRVYGGPGQEPQLITDEMWRAAQDKIAKNAVGKRRAKERHRPECYYSGLLVSGHEALIPEDDIGMRRVTPDMAVPKHVLWSAVSQGSRAPSYFCRCSRIHGERKKGTLDKCALRSLPAAEVNRAVDVYLERLCTGSWFLEGLRASLEAKEDSTATTDEAERARIKSAVSKVEARRKRVLDLSEAGDLTIAETRERLAKITTERKGLEADLAKLSKPAVKVDPEAVIAEAIKAMTFRASWTPEEKRAWVETNIHEIRIKNGGISSVYVRIHGGGSHAVSGVTWESLLGYSVNDDRARINALVSAGGYLDIYDLAARLGLSVPGVRRRLEKGTLPKPATQVWKRWVWTEDQIEALT